MIVQKRFPVSSEVTLQRYNTSRYFDGQWLLFEWFHLAFLGNDAYQQLISCPLLCQLFCFLYSIDGTFPEKVTEVYYRLIECLIR